MKITRAKKHLGQNFLQDKRVIHAIIAAIDPKPEQTIIEIGPGLGALTRELLAITHALHVIEIDADLIPLLIPHCQGLGELLVHQADVLTVDFNQFYHNEKKLRIVGNLPYNISTPVLFHLLKYQPIIEDMHFMLQKEVVTRICASPGGKEYGRLSVMVQYHCETEALLQVPPSAFHPVPKVHSAIVRLRPRAILPLTSLQHEKFTLIVRQAFNHRRKTLQNSLRNFVTPEQWQLTSIDPLLRPEQLTVQNFIQLALI